MQLDQHELSPAATPEPVDRPAPPTDPLRRRAVRAAARVPVLVWCVTGLHVTLLLAYSILLPAFRAPDEPHHADLAHVMSEQWDYPAWDERNISNGVMRSLNIVHFHTPRRSAHLTEAEAPPKGTRPSFEDLGDDTESSGINQNSQHPPLYYVLTGTAARVTETITGGDLSFDVEVWLYRLVSVALVAPLPLVAWRVAALLGLPEPVGVAAALVPLAIPQLTHIGSAINNDDLLLLAFWLTTPVVLRIAGGKLSLRTAALAGALTGVAALTKGLALVLPLWVGAGLLIALRRGWPERLGPVLRAGAVYGAVAFATGGWWWLRNLVLYRKLAPSRFNSMLPPAPDRQTDLDQFVRTWGYATTRRFWGDFGWFDTHLHALTFGLATAVVVGAIVVALATHDRVAGTDRVDRLLLAAPLLLLVSLQFANALRAYTTTGHMPGLQGRYWFGAVAGVAVVVAIGLSQVLRRHLAWLPLGTLLGVLAMQAAAIVTLLGFYWGAPHAGFAERLRAVVAWAPLPGELIGVGAVLGAGVLAATVVLAIRTALAPARGPAPA